MCLFTTFPQNSIWFMTYSARIQKPDLRTIIELFELVFAGQVLRFTPGPRNQAIIRHAGNQYMPVPIKVDGYSMTSAGSVPRPTLSISNIDNLMTPVIAEHDDLVGAKVTRIRIFENNLDGALDEDPSQTFPPDIHFINKKTIQTREKVEWELVASIDQEGVKLPRRQVLRDYCQSVYRIWDAVNGRFDYAKATCPYTGSSCFDRAGKSVSSTDDECGKSLSDCKLRFGEKAVLPFDGFPGVARIRRR